MRLRYWLDYRLGDFVLWKKFFGTLRRNQKGSQEFKYNERCVERGTRYGFNIQSFEIRTEIGSSGLGGSARISFLMVPGTRIHKGEQTPKDRRST
jgi:hypothetical protein